MRLGLIVNPIAGMGGRVGLKGTDGLETLRRALELGAQPESPRRAEAALRRLGPRARKAEILTCPGMMGEAEVRASGLDPLVVGRAAGDAAATRGLAAGAAAATPGLAAGAAAATGAVTGGATPAVTDAATGWTVGDTTAADTVGAAREMLAAGVDLLLFAGGDGTARDICRAVGLSLPVLGIPTGVKMHSAVYATSPGAAGDLARLFLEGRVRRFREAEVMDIDEEAFRDGRLSARLHGYLKVPVAPGLVQNLKAGSSGQGAGGGGTPDLRGLASRVVGEMEKDCLYIIGPGTTTRAITDVLGLPKTLLGVDVVRNGELVAADANERRLLSLLQTARPGRAKVIVTVIGGQGYIFGRGNQQISHRVLRQVGRENIIVVADKEKLLSLAPNPLLVDTGDEETDRWLSGHIRVITGPGEQVVCRVH